MQNIQFKIDGMTCQGCVNSVRHALEAISGVESVAVDLVKGEADVSYTDKDLNPTMLIRAIEDAGFDVVQF